MSTFLDTKHRLINLSEQAVPPTPSSTNGTIFLSSVTGNISIKKDTGANRDLEDHNDSSTYVANEHINHTSILIQGAANSGINVDAGTTAVDLTAGTKQLALNVNNLSTAVAIDPATDTIAIYDTSTASTVKATIQDILDSASVGSTNGFYNESNGESSMTSTTLAQKLRLTFTAEAADYEIWYSAEISSDLANITVTVQLEEDDTTIIALHDHKAATGSPGFYGFSGHVKRTLTAASHNFDIDYNSSQNAKTVRIRRARIFAQKVTT